VDIYSYRFFVVQIICKTWMVSVYKED